MPLFVARDVRDGVSRWRCLMADTDRFRLRRFVEKLVQMGEGEVREQPTELLDVAAAVDGNAKAVLFRAVGAEKAELVGNVMASRRRLAIAFGTDEEKLLPVLAQRLAQPHAPTKISAKEAPVQEIVLTGKDADLC